MIEKVVIISLSTTLIWADKVIFDVIIMLCKRNSILIDKIINSVSSYTSNIKLRKLTFVFNHSLQIQIDLTFPCVHQFYWIY